MDLARRGARLLLAASVGLGFACGSPQTDASDDAAITASACKVFNNQTGKPMTAVELARLDDPIARKLLEGKDCPTSYTAALAKLRTNDTKGCKDAMNGEQVDGLGTFLVSEKVAHMSEEDAAKATFRSVTSKRCDQREGDEMLFSSFASTKTLPDTNVEMIGKDRTTGVFNYYEVIDGGQWVFYGTSFDFVGSGYTCKPSGACVSNNSKKASSPTRKSCASCHISGGLVMKELASPWVHWTAEIPLGSDAVMEKHAAKLGNQMGGENLELLVRAGFENYNQRRIDFLATKGLAELLRPLFCTLDVNLLSESSSHDLIADKSLTRQTPNIDDDIYQELKKEVRQRLHGIPTADDTAVAFTFPVKGAIDDDYTTQLKELGLLDDELAADVRSVDFTRPLFSGLRCGLLEPLEGKTGPVDAKLARFAGAKDKKERSRIAAELRKEIPALFASVLEGKTGRTPAEKAFLLNLTDPKQSAAAHVTRAHAFVTKCNQRWAEEPDRAKKKAATLELMTFASHLRTLVRTDVVGFNGQDLLEGKGRDDKMVVDDITDNDRAFDPDGCRLVLPPSALRAP